MMEENSILELLKYGESINLECKKAENAVPNSVWETYSSFANTDGGIILLGVEENMTEPDINKRFSFTSVKNPKQRIIEFWNTINSNKVSRNILVDADVGTCKVRGADVIWIKVPQADYHDKPVYINENPMKGSFKRNHEGDYHCTEEEVRAMLRDANDSGCDGSLLNGYTMDDIDLNALHSYRIEFEHRNPEHVWNANDDLTFLKNLGGYATDRTTGKEWLTTAGLLMFGKGLPIRERFDNIRMDYIDESNLAPGSRWSDRLTYDGTWENNLYNFIRQVVPKLVLGLKRPFRMEGMIRVDDTPVHKSVREAVTNLIIHADYMTTGVLKIKKMDTGFEFSNPGTLKIPVQAIYEGGYSIARNPRIQTMLRMIGYGENIGSGIPTILGAWENENWRKPDLSQNEDVHVVELKLWMTSLMPDECIEYLQGLFGSSYMQLDREEQLILGTAYLEGSVTNVRMQTMLKRNGVEVGHILAKLVDKDMLTPDKRGRWTSYTLNKEYECHVEEQYTDSVNQQVLTFNNETDKKIFEYVKVNEFITAQEVLKITCVTSVQGANVALGRLMKIGLLEKERCGKRYIYKLSKMTG